MAALLLMDVTPATTQHACMHATFQSPALIHQVELPPTLCLSTDLVGAVLGALSFAVDGSTAERRV